MRREPGRRAAAWRAARVLALLALASGAAGRARTAAAQAAQAAGASYTPVTALVTAGDRAKEITFVGRNDEGVVFTEGESGIGMRRVLAYDRIDEVSFRLKLDHGQWYRYTRQRDWAGLVRYLYPIVRPTLPYLDLENNNAVQPALDLGDAYMRMAAQHLREADTDAAVEQARKQYMTAYAVLKYVEQAAWTHLGQIAALKRVGCLLALEKPVTAGTFFARIEEPMAGDAAYGLYWLVKARLALEKRDYRAGMQAAVRSLCFENKDVDTFPDALLISAQCYEELQQWHRARDVYYEVARIFPKTDWSDLARRRLRFIMDRGLTKDEEVFPIENVFFAFKEDMNQLVRDLLDNTPAADAGAAGASSPPPPRTGTRGKDGEEEVDLNQREK
jgi:tetratricopeptide (TPR) repeat protein